MDVCYKSCNCMGSRVVAMVACGVIWLPALHSMADTAEMKLEDVVVTARRRTEPTQVVPGSITVRGVDELDAAGMRDLRSAARGVPSLTLGTFSARRLTFPYVRGIGAGQNAPGVTTYIDGVSQLSYVTANQELLGVERIEFLRGPQAALYGANSLGGVIQIVPRLPASDPAGRLMLTGGSDSQYEARLSLEGPMGRSGLLGSAAGGYATRDGYTRNTVTGNDIDSREAWFGRAQIYWPGEGIWDARLSLTMQRDRDGGYALYDLASIRANPHRVSHDFEGYNHRDLAQPVLTLRRQGDGVDFTSITAWQWWQTRDRTDLDYTPADLARKDAREDAQAWIQEWRLASPSDAPVALSERLSLHWLAGVYAFMQDYERRDITSYRPGGVAFGLWPAPFDMQQDASQDNAGASLFGHGTLTLDERWELGLGLRHDYQHRRAESATRFPPGPPMPAARQSRSFNQVSPRASLGYRVRPAMLVYTDVSKGYRAGGFNAIAPPNRGSYDEEISINYEAGVKTAWLERRLILNAALFYTDWEDIQVNALVPGGSPADYYIENGGTAWSRGGEIELTAQPLSWLQLFGSLGVLDTRYRQDSQAASADVAGNRLPFAPRLTWQAGIACSQALGAHRRVFARSDIAGSSRYYYDASNAESQGSHALVNLRLGIASGPWRAEGWVHNLFDRETVPLAIPYGPDAQGNPTYIGESGPPRTVGVSLARVF